MLQQNQGPPKKVRVEAIRPFYKSDLAGDGSRSSQVIGIGDVVEVSADVAADLVSCGKAQETEKAIGKAPEAKGKRAAA